MEYIDRSMQEGKSSCCKIYPNSESGGRDPRILLLGGVRVLASDGKTSVYLADTLF